MNREYRPCGTGLHVCGIDPIAERFRTVENLPLPEPGARHVWGAAVARLAMAADDDPDVMVDLFVDGNLIENFGMRRQHVGDLLVLAENYTDWSKAPFHAE